MAASCFPSLRPLFLSQVVYCIFGVGAEWGPQHTHGTSLSVFRSSRPRFWMYSHWPSCTGCPVRCTLSTVSWASSNSHCTTNTGPGGTAQMGLASVLCPPPQAQGPEAAVSSIAGSQANRALCAGCRPPASPAPFLEEMPCSLPAPWPGSQGLHFDQNMVMMSLQVWGWGGQPRPHTGAALGSSSKARSSSWMWKA